MTPEEVIRVSHAVGRQFIQKYFVPPRLWDDVEGEAVLASYQELQRFYQPSMGASENTFLFRRVYWRLQDWWRRQIGRRNIHREPLPLLDDIIPQDDTALRMISDRDEVQTLLRKLPGDILREVVLLRFFSHLNQQEVAAAIGLSVSRVSQLQRQALNIMRRARHDREERA